jgi:thioredoxin reductase (NADPH)
MRIEKVIIIGSGPSGLTAAIYAARAGLAPIVICGGCPGGQLINADFVENFPGFPSIRGSDLMLRMMDQATTCGVEMMFDQVVSLKKSENIFDICIETGEVKRSRSMIIATGASHRSLNIPGEREFINRGVSYCAVCDGPLLKGKDVAVVGGGNTALMESVFLSNFCRNVYLIHRRASFRADAILQKRLLSCCNIKCIFDSVVMEAKGTNKLEYIVIENVVKKRIETLEISGLFAAIGTEPASKFADHLVELDQKGYIIAENTVTSCQGLFAAGDIVSGSIKQAITAAAAGCLASKKAEEFLLL